MPGDAHNSSTSSAGQEGALWAGVLGAPIAWALNFQTAYALTEHACGHGTSKWIYLCHVFFLCLSCAALVLAILTRGKRHPDDAEFENKLSRRRFMSLLGVLMSAMFSLIIAAQLMASIMVPPCAT